MDGKHIKNLRQSEDTDQQIAELNRQLAEKERLIVERDKQIESLLNSYSWKVSAIFRFIGGILLALVRWFHQLRNESGPEGPVNSSENEVGVIPAASMENEESAESALSESSVTEPDDMADVNHSNIQSEKKLRLSVIIPSYNHAAFLERRLSSIINQSLKPDEIIFLDDASPDESVKIATNILLKCDIPYKIISNEKNSGNVFKQWIKGIDHATGDLVWIAESDDEAAPDFLANLLPQFEREDILLAYGDISYITTDGTHNDDLKHYYDGLEDLCWDRSHIVTAYRAFTGAFAVKNIIPNASGAVFRKPSLSDIEKERLTSYTFAGDWYFYAVISRGGSIAFCKEAKSFFRLHQQSTSRKVFFTDRHINEHRMVLDDLNELYHIGEQAVKNHVMALWTVIANQSPDITLDDLMAMITIDSPKRRIFRICIASYGFTVGGGEVVPIDIANALRSLGHHVTFLALFRRVPHDQNLLRQRLRNDIPVSYWDDVKHRFNDFLCEYGIEILNSHNVGVEYSLYRAGVQLDIPYIASLHGGYETVPELLSTEFIRYVGAMVSEWLYLSEKNIEPLQSRGLCDTRFTKSFNAIFNFPPEMDCEHSIREDMGLSRDTTILVLASRAIYEKGWQLAIDVIRKLRETEGIDCHLFLVGDGPALNDLKEANAGTEFISFLGRLDNPYPVIKECDIGIFPSTYSGESFPLFVLECLQNGLPVIATDIGEIPYIMGAIEGGMPGEVVARSRGREGIIEDMTQSIVALIRNRNAMDSAKKQAINVAQHFSKERLIELYLKVIYSHLEARR